MNIRQIALAAALLAAIPAAGAVQNIDRSLATGPAPTVDVSNVQGKVTVVAWDRAEVKVTGTLENDEHVFELSGDERRVVIKVEAPDRGKSRKYSWGRKDDAILDIRVPEGASLKVQAVSADVDVRGVKGAQRLESVSGDVVATVYDEQLDLRTISGNADIRGAGGKAMVYAESTSGNVVARNLGSGVEAQSVSGNVDVETGTAGRLRLETVSGNLKALLTLADGGRVDAQSVSGNVTLRFRKPVNAEFEVESFSGTIDNCFGPQAERSGKYTPGRELHFSQGSGSGRVSLETLSGDVSFCDQ